MLKTSKGIIFHQIDILVRKWATCCLIYDQTRFMTFLTLSIYFPRFALWEARFCSQESNLGKSPKIQFCWTKNIFKECFPSRLVSSFLCHISSQVVWKSFPFKDCFAHEPNLPDKLSAERLKPRKGSTLREKNLSFPTQCWCT